MTEREKVMAGMEFLTNDPELITSVLDVGDGVALSVYLGEKK